MKRVLIVSPFPPSIIGGVSISTQRLVDSLNKENLHIYKFDIRYKNNRYNNSKLLKLIKFLSLVVYLLVHKRYDVIHFHISGSILRMIVTIYRPLFSKKTKFISTLHGDASNLINEKYGKKCLKGFDEFICVKKGDSIILSKFFKGIIHEIPAFIPPVINDDYEQAIPSEVSKFINKDNKKIILWNGSVICSNQFSDLYGLEDTVDTFIKLMEQNKDVKLILMILGEGRNKEEFSIFNRVKEKADRYKNNILLFKVNNSELWPILKKSDLFIRSAKTDGDALSVREALCLMTPVVATDVAPRPSGTILYSNKDDLLQKLLHFNFDEKPEHLDNTKVISKITSIYNSI
jgi:glycosyltransferase involved in cell wall biosynthesis